MVVRVAVEITVAVLLAEAAPVAKVTMVVQVIQQIHMDQVAVVEPMLQVLAHLPEKVALAVMESNGLMKQLTQGVVVELVSLALLALLVQVVVVQA
jgi:tetrahydromethanopterin S-methyltransferase subunit B